MSAPTFVIGGAQRCGTTWLCELLDEHPDVFMAQPRRPEPKFFLEAPAPGRDREWYLSRWFADTKDAHAVGEKSTSYIESAAAARRMDEMFPGIRAVFLLRHPAERAVSNHAFSVHSGMETETLAHALDLEPERVGTDTGPATSVNPFAYTARGHYHHYLAPYFETLGPDRVCVLIYERLKQRPLEELARLFEFLGVAPAFEPRDVATRHNQAAWGSERLPRATLEALIEGFQASNRRLETLVGCDVSHWDRPTPALLALTE